MDKNKLLVKTIYNLLSFLLIENSVKILNKFLKWKEKIILKIGKYRKSIYFRRGIIICQTKKHTILFILKLIILRLLKYIS